MINKIICYFILHKFKRFSVFFAKCERCGKKEIIKINKHFNKLNEKIIDPMVKWNDYMEKLIGKEKWRSLTYWDKMQEVSRVQQCWKENPISKIFGLNKDK